MTSTLGLEGLGDLLAGEVQTWEAEKRYIHADGHIVVGRGVGLGRRDEAGEPLYIVAQTRDISEHKRLRASSCISPTTTR